MNFLLGNLRKYTLKSRIIIQNLWKNYYAWTTQSVPVGLVFGQNDWGWKSQFLAQVIFSKFNLIII